MGDVVLVVGIRVEEEVATWDQHASDLLDCLACNFVRHVDKRCTLYDKVKRTVFEADFWKRFDSQVRCETGSGQSSTRVVYGGLTAIRTRNRKPFRCEK